MKIVSQAKRRADVKKGQDALASGKKKEQDTFTLSRSPSVRDTVCETISRGRVTIGLS